MRDRTIVIGFFAFIVLTGVLLSGNVFGVIAVVVALLVVGIIVALQPRNEDRGSPGAVPDSMGSFEVHQRQTPRF